MRKISIGQPPFDIALVDQKTRWMMTALLTIQRASGEQITEEIADAYTLGTFTVTRTLNPATATISDVANVLATILQDMKNRGVKRG